LIVELNLLVCVDVVYVQSREDVIARREMRRERTKQIREARARRCIYPSRAQPPASLPLPDEPQDKLAPHAKTAPATGTLNHGERLHELLVVAVWRSIPENNIHVNSNN
jgi:hypothetical protein